MAKKDSHRVIQNVGSALPQPEALATTNVVFGARSDPTEGGPPERVCSQIGGLCATAGQAKPGIG